MNNEDDFTMSSKADNPVNTVLGAISYYGSDYKSIMNGVRIFLNSLDKGALIDAYNNAFGKSVNDFEGVRQESVANDLTETIINGDTETPQVVIKERTIEYHACPHCKKEIHEKHSYVKNWNAVMEDSNLEMVHVHKDCGGEYMHPPTPQSEKDAWYFNLR
jgi:hypothetical protein